MYKHRMNNLSIVKMALSEVRMAFDDAGRSVPFARMIELRKIIRDALQEIGGVLSANGEPDNPILSGRPKGDRALDASKLQNRDRSRRAYIEQMQAMSNAIDYQRLSSSRSPATGAPMAFSRGVSIPRSQAGAKDTVVMSDGAGGTRKVDVIYAVIEAADLIASHDSDGGIVDEYGGDRGIMALNNGRSAAIKSAYQKGKGDSYRSELMADNSHSINPKVIEGMRQPVLVRLFDEGDLAGIDDPGAASNDSEGARLSTAEQAATDAQRLPSEVILRYEGGDITAERNRDFVSGFIQAVGGSAAAGEMLGSDGRLSQIGMRRIEAALVAKAYGNSNLLAGLTESTDDELKSIGNAIKEVAGQWSLMVDRAKLGVSEPSLDITKNIIDALNMIRRSRREGVHITTLLDQNDVFSGATDPTTYALVKMMYRPGFSRVRSAAQIADGLRGYLTKVENTPPGPDMFGTTVTPIELIEQQSSILSEDEELRKKQQGLFDSAMQPSVSRKEARRKTAAILDYMAHLPS